ncbi:mapeg family protein [Stylonychia lemnae]|uniref:Mapeg family protein n=1 Tax=Stylonychia lemnae TaxID=5949 RepID=A0A077ZTY2_STYLE|nr:mapeg family protein [Stylonychia lemnae]|eukprot:CDW73034.1 mapeg family protein [Stylonychia lemnae]
MVLNIIPDNHADLFPYVLIVMTAICLECFLTSFIQGSKRKVFTKIMEKFKDQHLQDFNKKPAAIGHPDCGYGRYSDELTYKEWFDYNNAQRVHLNFVEQLPIMMVLIYLAALKQPLAALILSCTYFACRLAYAISYIGGGPNLRIVATAPSFGIKWTLYGLSFYTVSCYLDQYPKN